MKSSWLGKVIGVGLVVIAFAGILFSLAGIGLVWRFKNPLTDQALAKVGTFIYIVDTTTQGLELVSQALKTAEESTTTLETAMQVMSSTIQDSAHRFDTAAKLSGEDLPDTIIALQKAMRSAQTSAKLVDDTIKLLSALPFFPAEKYNPDVPLSVSLGEMADSLNEMPEMFHGITDDLQDADKKLGNVQTQTANIGDQIKHIKESVVAGQGVVAKYQVVLGELRPSLSSLQTKLPRWITLGTWGITAILAWLGFAQIGLLLQGLTLLQSGVLFTSVSPVIKGENE